MSEVKFEILASCGVFNASEFELEELTPLDKRRLSVSSKAAFTIFKRLCHECDLETWLTSGKKLPLVFASHAGEVNRCKTLLDELRSSGFVSPTSFSLSVLNATPATLAILTQNKSEIEAVSAVQSLENGLLAGFVMLGEFERVLVLSYDEVLGSGEFEAVGVVLARCDFGGVSGGVAVSLSRKSGVCEVARRGAKAEFLANLHSGKKAWESGAFRIQMAEK